MNKRNRSGKSPQELIAYVILRSDAFEMLYNRERNTGQTGAFSNTFVT